MGHKDIQTHINIGIYTYTDMHETLIYKDAYYTKIMITETQFR